MNGTTPNNSTIPLPPNTVLMNNAVALSSLTSFVLCTITLLCCLYLNLYKNSAKRYIMYTLISSMVLSAAHMGRFYDWNNVPTQGFWCQWSGYLTVVGSNSVCLWITATATYLVLVFFGKNPGSRLEIAVIIIWPFFGIIPATIPYAIFPHVEVYVPLATGQCFFENSQLLVYLVSIWELFLIVYILLAYLAVIIQMYNVSKQVEFTLIIQKPQDRDKMKKFWLSLAVSPLMYWVLYICVVVARILQLLEVHLPLDFVRVSVILYILVGSFYSLWMGYSSEIYSKTYKKLCWVTDIDEASLLNK